jgi:hypothetical protein
MIVINKEINPEREVYYLGAVVIEILKDMPKKEADLLDVFQLLNKKIRVSMNLFILTLDWLYLMGSIKHNEGCIAKCF